MASMPTDFVFEPLPEKFSRAVLLADFLNFLRFLKEYKTPLTLTGNLNLKSLALIDKFIPQPEHFKKYYPIRTASEWRYLERIDALAMIMRVAMRRKKHLILTSLGKRYLGLPAEEQFKRLFFAYWNYLNWEFLFPFGCEEGKGQPANCMQNRRYMAAGELLRFAGKSDDWKSIQEFAKHLREKFSLRLVNYLGQDLPERVLDCVWDVFLGQLWRLGLVETDNTSDQRKCYWPKNITAFRLTSLGRDFLANEVLPENPRSSLEYLFSLS